MSSSKALASTSFAGLRVAGEITYVPASIRPSDGKEIQQRCIIPVYQNTGRDDAAGNSIAHVFKLTSWGGLADVCAKSMPRGKEFHAVCTPRSFKGRAFYADRSPVMEKDGTPLMVTKIGFNLDDLSLGADSRQFLDGEYARKARGPQWQTPGTQDHAAWLAKVTIIKAMKYTPGVNPTTGKPIMERFGYAKVELYNNTVAPPFDAQANVQATFAGPDAAVNPNLPIDPALQAAAIEAAKRTAILAEAGFTVDAAGNIVPAVAAAVATDVPLF